MRGSISEKSTLANSSKPLFERLPKELSMNQVISFFYSITFKKGDEISPVVTTSFLKILDAKGLLKPILGSGATKKMYYNQEMLVLIYKLAMISKEYKDKNSIATYDTLRRAKNKGGTEERAVILIAINNIIKENSFDFLKKQDQFEDEVVYDEGELPEDFSYWPEQ